MSPASQDEDEDDDDVSDHRNKTSSERDSSTSNKNVATDALRSELAMEIDSLNNMTRRHCENTENDIFLRTRLPSFSSIIGNAASEMIATTTCSSDASLLSVMHSTSASDLVLNGSGSHDHMMLNESDHHHLGRQHDDNGRDGDSDAGAIHSRRSSIDAGGLIIH